jgi:hypothetical protein
MHARWGYALVYGLTLLRERQPAGPPHDVVGQAGMALLEDLRSVR